MAVKIGDISERFRNRYFVCFSDPMHSESFRAFLLKNKIVAGPSELMFNVKIKEVVSSEYNVGLVDIALEKLEGHLDDWRKTLQ